MLCQVVFFRNLRGFFVRDVRAKGFAVSERGKDALDGEDLFFFCHFFCFVLHVITISEKIKDTRIIFGNRTIFFARLARWLARRLLGELGTRLAISESL